ncbi:hypothetical protein WJX77_010041 [Trebouxia sp. C0004]
MDDFDDLDFAALDALEASHLASKQNQSSVNPAACFSTAAARQGCVSISVAAAQPPPSLAGKPQIDTSRATAFLSAAEAPKQGIPHNGVLPVPPFLHKHHLQHRQLQQMLAQTSVQSYIAAHSARGHLQQPVSTTFGSSASVPHSLHQPQQQAITATGVLADAEDLCIDLTSQPDGTAAADAHTAGDENAMHLAPLRPAAAVPTPAEASIRAQEAQAAEEGTSEDVLMECSTNLLNPGIRVHKSNAKNWVYPASVPERAYQIDIINTALLQNTLVCLPTGLGKTLIAAVIMHNFTRWFPEGKVVFVAPTKPLVNQQIEACYEFMGVSKTSIEELTGSCKRLDRQDLWELPYKRIFFCTPQTFRNDVDRGICPHKKIVCLVVDECHRAKGNSDVVLAVKKLREEKCKFRVLGLSATPGSNNESIQEVIDNLMISAIQYRSETDPDIQPHVHQRCVDERVVQSTREVDYCKQTLIHVLQDVLTSLARMQAYYGHVNAHTCQRFAFLQASDKYKDQPNKNPLAGMVFRQAMVLTDCRDQLDSYGIDTALKYLDGKLTESAIKRLLGENTMFNEFHKQLKSLVNRAATHPKMAALLEVVLQHFKPEGVPQSDSRPTAAAAGQVTPAKAAAGDGNGEKAVTDDPGRVIIFTNRRDSVQSIVEMLRAHEPLITARIFIGQASGKANGIGMKQAEQKKVLTDFRLGAFNTLVATCIGEEGLDIPQVDLIVCFDSDASPIRNIQRMGRTGRHKAGRVVYIMSQGKEEDSYRKGLQTGACLQTKLRRGNFQLLERPPRMLPRIFNPVQLNVDCSGKTPIKAAEGKKGRKPRGTKASGTSRASRPSSSGGRTGGRGRGSGNRSKQNSAASAGHAHSLNNAVSDETSNPGALIAVTAVAEQEHYISADADPSQMGTDDSDILEQLPLAERLAEKQHQRVQAAAAVRSRSKSPALDLPTYRATTLVGQSCHHVAMGVPDPAAAASASADSAHHSAVAGALPATCGLAAAAAAAKAVSKNGGRAAWARPLPRPSSARARPHLPSPAAPQVQQGVISTLTAPSRAEGTPAQPSDDRASAGSVQATSWSPHPQAEPKRCASEQQVEQAANLQAEQPSAPGMDGKQPAAEASRMKFLIEIDDSPADQSSAGPSGLSSHDNHGQPQLATTKPQHSRLQLNSCTAPDLAAGLRMQGHQQAANIEAGQKPHQEPAQTATRAPMPSGSGSPCIEPLLIDSMTVPDTPPYSSNSQAGSPLGDPRSGPTWLSPLLARHQSGQGRLYSPSMLGRPHGMHLATITVEATAATQHPAGHVGASSPGNQVLPEVSLPLSLNDRLEADARSAAPLQVGMLPNASAVKLGNYDPQQAWQQAAARQAHPVPGAKSPGDGIMAAATGVFANWDSQDAADEAAVLPAAAPSQAPIPELSPDGTTQVVLPGIVQISQLAPRATSSTPASPRAHCPQTQVAEQHVASVTEQRDDNTVLAPVEAICSTAQELAIAASQPACRRQLTDTSLQQTDAGIRPATLACEAVMSDQAADVSLATQAVDMPASMCKHNTSKAGEEVLQGMTTSVDAKAAALPADTDSAHHSQRDVLNGGSQQSNGNADELHAHDYGDSWDWQPTQGNFGYQNVFGASQSSQGWGLSDSWGDSHKAAWRKQQQAEADRPLVISSLPALGCRPAQQGFQAGPSNASEALPAAKQVPFSNKHVPFSNKRIPLPAAKPQVHTKQPGAAPAQLQEAPALPVRSRPKPTSGTKTALGPSATPDSQSVAASASHAVAHSSASAQINAQAAHPSMSKFPHQGYRLPPCNQSASTSRAGPIDQPYERLRPAGSEASAQHAAADTSGSVTAGSAGSDVTAAAVNRHSQATVTAPVDSSRVDPRSAVPSSSGWPTAVANRATASTTTNATAMSPAAAIFGPHIAATSSQSHARKKLCLRLGPRQLDAPPSSHPEHQKETDRQAMEQSAVGPQTAPDTAVGQAGPDASKQQGARGRHEVCLPAYGDACVLSPEAATPAGKSKPDGCPSPATAARIMPPPSTGRCPGPPGPAITAQAAAHTGSTPRPPHRKRRGRAAHGLVLMTQASPSSDSPQGNTDIADKGSDREEVPLQARLKRLKRIHNATAVPPTGPATASAPPTTAQGGSSRHGALHVKPKGLSKQDQRRRVAALIDIEAEASSEEEEGSSDEADEDTDVAEADAMFVNDASPASARSRRERRHEDMLAVYNQHLMLSGTPVLKLKERRFQHTPMADTPRSNASSTYDLEDSFLAEDEDASQDRSDNEVSQHDEACTICYQDDECDMLLCDGCPKVFHLTCLGLTNVPPGQWFCAVCNDGNI